MSHKLVNSSEPTSHLAADPDAFQSLVNVLDSSEQLTVIDGGAHVGQKTNQFLDVFPNATVHAFEPVAETFEKLRKNLVKTKRAQSWNLAIGAGNETTDMCVNGCTGTSSLLESEPRTHRYHGELCQTKRREMVQTVSLDDWADHNNIQRVDILKLDLQGYELEALRGATKLLSSSIKAVYSEAQLVPLYKDAALFTDIDLFLREAGFELYRIQELFFNGRERRSTCCDAIWLRSDVMAAYCDSLAEDAA